MSNNPIPPPEDALIQLSAALGRVVSNSRPEKTAALAYLQASLAQTAVQALIDLLRNQNVISREQIEKALNHAYNERYKQLAGSQSAVLMPGPTAKSS